MRDFPLQPLEELLSVGISCFSLCPGSRNAALVYPLSKAEGLNNYYWPEERSAAFFALGKIKATHSPVAVVTTSGTAAAELLPAVIEAYYTGLPLVVVTADRPRSFRGTGAPQAIEQKGLFGCYAIPYDLEEGETLSLAQWDRVTPLHINICLEEPSDAFCAALQLKINAKTQRRKESQRISCEGFIEGYHHPFFIVGPLAAHAREATIAFLKEVGAPFYAEAHSRIREEPALEPLRIKNLSQFWELSEKHYPIDVVIRLGGVPTARLWRDLETKKEVAVYSITDLPFMGLSHGTLLSPWPKCRFEKKDFTTWQEATSQDVALNKEEQALRALSEKIPKGSGVYLGNSLPIREWDKAATYEPRGFDIESNRGANGIDGQLSTFLGWAQPGRENWALLGDLTFLYDLAAPWVASQLKDISTAVVIINNGGGAIFKPMFHNPLFLNAHDLSFAPMAEFWGWSYDRWEGSVPSEIAPLKKGEKRLIELKI